MKKLLSVLMFSSFLALNTSCVKLDDQNAQQQKSDESSITKSESVEMNIEQSTIENTISEMITKFGDQYKDQIKKGVQQTANLWRGDNGSPEEFKAFCLNNFYADGAEKDLLFERINRNYEMIYGYYHKMTLDLQRPVHLSDEKEHPIDLKFASWNPLAHLNQDFYNNKIAFVITLNYPTYSLPEKAEMSANWTSKDWAKARIGDMYTSRIPSNLLMNISTVMSNGDDYISNYNIHVGYLRDDNGNQLFDEDKKLITHWNLRDEIKSQYSNEDGLDRQRIIYKVMNHIINQTIPQMVISSSDYTWNPYQNKVYKDNSEMEFTAEPNTRYQHLLNNFHAQKAIDPYSPLMPSAIKRNFEGNMEIPQEEVEKLFVEFISSPQVAKVAELIKKRLGRDLQPWDIWYDGFKSRSSYTDADLSAITKKRYPNKDVFKADLSNILVKLGFKADRAQWIASKIEVNPSRGAGHASGAEMKSDVSSLRTRIGNDGMDYKGYNIGIHEFGHNVEQTLTLHDVDYYMMNGVPNTAFTEAWAFIFQKQDLELLGMKENNPDKELLQTLDLFWASYEIMGVSVVDMRIWKWMYENPDANAEEVKQATVKIAIDVWNEFFAPVFGVKDQPILAIYSHMIDYPLYLSAYPIGKIIQFQVESYIKGKNLGDEMQRICAQGRVLPQTWMKGAVGSEISIKPLLDAVDIAVDKMAK